MHAQKAKVLLKAAIQSLAMKLNRREVQGAHLLLKEIRTLLALAGA